jgi:hypothetical protein
MSAARGSGFTAGWPDDTDDIGPLGRRILFGCVAFCIWPFLFILLPFEI